MTDRERSKVCAKAQQHKAILVVCMFIITAQQSVFVIKHGLGFLEADAVLRLVDRSLPIIPLKPDRRQT